jgi:hypothetical protein
MFGTQSSQISELTGMEESGQSELFIELLRSAIDKGPPEFITNMFAIF